mgnify:CR=1 FL=1
MAELLLITADDCRFCDRARALLDLLGVDVRELPAGSAEARELARRGVAAPLLPLLTDGERVLAYGRFSERHLRRELGVETRS